MDKCIASLFLTTTKTAVMNIVYTCLFEALFSGLWGHLNTLCGEISSFKSFAHFLKSDSFFLVKF